MTMTEERPTETSVDTLTLTMRAPELGTLLKSALASAGSDDARPILSAVRIEVVSDAADYRESVRTVTTDSYTLLIQELAVKDANECAVTGSGIFHIPAATVKDWVKALASRDLKTSLAVLQYTPASDERPGSVVLSLANATFTTEENYGGFPDYAQLIPSEREWTHEGAAFNPTLIARLAAIIPPGHVKGESPWTCESMSATRTALWTCKTAFGYSGTFLQMPVRVK